MLAVILGTILEHETSVLYRRFYLDTEIVIILRAVSLLQKKKRRCK